MIMFLTLFSIFFVSLILWFFAFNLMPPPILESSDDVVPQEELSIEPIPYCGDGMCYGGSVEDDAETSYSCPQDCPSCDDGDICTSDSYNYISASCHNYVRSPCCGDGLCESGESSSCDADCKKPFVGGDLELRDSGGLLEMDGDLITMDKSLIEDNPHYTGRYDDANADITYDDVEVNVLNMVYVIEANQRTIDPERDLFEVSFECEDQFGAITRAEGDFGWHVREINDTFLYVVDETYLRCHDYSGCTNYGGEPEDRSLVASIHEAGRKIELKIALFFNPVFEVHLNCDVEIEADELDYSTDFNFEVDYS